MHSKLSLIELFPLISRKIRKSCASGITSARSSAQILSITHRSSSTFSSPIRTADPAKANKTYPLTARFLKITAAVAATSFGTATSMPWCETTLVRTWRRKTPCFLLVSRGTCALKQAQPDNQPGILPEDAHPEPRETRGTDPQRHHRPQYLGKRPLHASILRSMIIRSGSGSTHQSYSSQAEDVFSFKCEGTSFSIILGSKSLKMALLVLSGREEGYWAVFWAITERRYWTSLCNFGGAL